jgi:ABC-type nickel/cobalt efflux system permease component RcnA
MKNGIITCFFIFLSLVLSGCQESANHQEHQVASEEEVKAPKVEIIASEHVNKNEEVPIAAKVYYGEDLVDDAEVTFEIKLGDVSEKIEAKLIETGTYGINYQFKEDGTYKITAHTNVESYHTMPSLDIQVGEGSKATITDKNDEKESENEHQHHEQTEAGHHHSSVTITVNELTGFKVNEEEQLSATIQEGEQPFPDATVRFEIWKDGEEQHKYIDAEEASTKGTYTSSYQFEETGMYKIVVHVEKGEVHDHIETSVEVQ